MADEALFVADGDALEPTEWAVGPWSADALQASAYGGLLVRALERTPVPADMMIARLSFDLWRPVTREPITTAVTVLREGRKAQTLEASLLQAGKPVARCTGVFLKADVASTPPTAPLAPPAQGPDAGRPLPLHVKGWSPFFTGVDTRVVAGDLLEPGPASAWFHLTRPLVLGEENSPLVHATSAAASRAAPRPSSTSGPGASSTPISRWCSGACRARPGSSSPRRRTRAIGGPAWRTACSRISTDPSGAASRR